MSDHAAEHVLQVAEDLVLRGERRYAYGEPVDALDRVAAAWTAIDGRPYTARQVAILLATLKLTREAHRHDPTLDGLTDAAGYVLMSALAAERERP